MGNVTNMAMRLRLPSGGAEILRGNKVLGANNCTTAEEQLNREMSREYGAEELGVYYATKRAVWVALAY